MEGIVTQGHYNYFLFELLATETIVTPDPADILNYYVRGVGIRIAVRGAIVSGQAGFSMGGLSASATLRGTATAFQLGALGIGIADWTSLMSYKSNP